MFKVEVPDHGSVQALLGERVAKHLDDVGAVLPTPPRSSNQNAFPFVFLTPGKSSSTTSVTLKPAGHLDNEYQVTAARISTYYPSKYKLRGVTEVFSEYQGVILGTLPPANTSEAHSHHT